MSVSISLLNTVIVMETAVMDCVMVDDYHCLLNTGFDLWLFQSVKNGRCNKMKAHPALFGGSVICSI